MLSRPGRDRHQLRGTRLGSWNAPLHHAATTRLTASAARAELRFVLANRTGGVPDDEFRLNHNFAASCGGAVCIRSKARKERVADPVAGDVNRGQRREAEFRKLY